ncbi:MAG TPA: response regulator [Porticoccaceae bacterium]
MNPFPSKNRDVVLVVDDSPETLSMLNDVLDGEGLTVLVALEGIQALTIASTIAPDLILLDAVMPHLDGFETCRHLKADPRTAYTPVIFMTGLSDSESVVKGFEAGGVDYVSKPIRTEELLARMRVHLANARIAHSTRAALDQTGNFLFSCDSSGRLLWATPQAENLLALSGATDEWLRTGLPRSLAPLLTGRHGRDRPLPLTGLSREVQVLFMGQTGPHEYLLRLADPQRPSGADLLKEAYGLTEREAEVLLWLAKGKTNGEIGLILSISPRTVNKHLEQVFRKLGVENRTAAATMVIQCMGKSPGCEG